MVARTAPRSVSPYTKSTDKKKRPLSGEQRALGVEIADDLIFIIGRSIFSGGLLVNLIVLLLFLFCC